MNVAALPLSPVAAASAAARPHAQGAYDLLVNLGSGGMGDVLLAARRGREGFRKLCVIKQLRPELEKDVAFRAMFAREARIAARMNHANVVSTDEIGEHDGALYIAMEYLEGQTLRTLIGEVVARRRHVDAAVWVAILCDALEGLHHVHEQRDFDGSDLGLVHADMSPHNVCLTYDGRVALIDFGSALITRDGVDEREFVTGKLAYMSPECIASEPLDRRADIFSVGVVLWELLAGMHVPRGDGSPGAKPRAITPLSAVMEDIDPELEAIVARAVALERDARYPTAAAMRAALEGYAERAKHTVRRSAIGRLMSELFADDRRALDEMVRGRMARLEEMTGSGVRPRRTPLPPVKAPPPKRQPSLLDIPVAWEEADAFDDEDATIALSRTALSPWPSASSSPSTYPSSPPPPAGVPSVIVAPPPAATPTVARPELARPALLDDVDDYVAGIERTRERRQLMAIGLSVLSIAIFAMLVVLRIAG